MGTVQREVPFEKRIKTKRKKINTFGWKMVMFEILIDYIYVGRKCIKMVNSIDKFMAVLTLFIVLNAANAIDTTLKENEPNNFIQETIKRYFFYIFLLAIPITIYQYVREINFRKKIKRVIYLASRSLRPRIYLKHQQHTPEDYDCKKVENEAKLKPYFIEMRPRYHDDEGRIIPDHVKLKIVNDRMRLRHQPKPYYKDKTIYQIHAVKITLIIVTALLIRMIFEQTARLECTGSVENFLLPEYTTKRKNTKDPIIGLIVTMTSIMISIGVMMFAEQQYKTDMMINAQALLTRIIDRDMTCLNIPITCYILLITVITLGLKKTITMKGALMIAIVTVLIDDPMIIMSTITPYAGVVSDKLIYYSITIIGLYITYQICKYLLTKTEQVPLSSLTTRKENKLSMFEWLRGKIIIIGTLILFSSSVFALSVHFWEFGTACLERDILKMYENIVRMTMLTAPIIICILSQSFSGVDNKLYLIRIMDVADARTKIGIHVISNLYIGITNHKPDANILGNYVYGLFTEPRLSIAILQGLAYSDNAGKMTTAMHAIDGYDVYHGDTQIFFNEVFSYNDIARVPGAGHAIAQNQIDPVMTYHRNGSHLERVNIERIDGGTNQKTRYRTRQHFTGGNSGAPVMQNGVFIGTVTHGTPFGYFNEKEITAQSVSRDATVIIEGVDTTFEIQNCKVFVLHCGAGKSSRYIPEEIARRKKENKRVIVSVPTRIVASQMVDLPALQNFQCQVQITPKIIRGDSEDKLCCHPTLLKRLIPLMADPRLLQEFRRNYHIIIDEAHVENPTTMIINSLIQEWDLPASLYTATWRGHTTYATNHTVYEEPFHPRRFMTLLEKHQHEKIIVYPANRQHGKAIESEIKNRMKNFKVFTLSRDDMGVEKDLMNDIRSCVEPCVILSTSVSEIGANMKADVVIDFLRSPKLLAFIDQNNPELVTFATRIVPITIASKVQRRGRVGRDKVGYYYYVSDVIIEEALYTVNSAALSLAKSYLRAHRIPDRLIEAAPVFEINARDAEQWLNSDDVAATAHILQNTFRMQAIDNDDDYPRDLYQVDNKGARRILDCDIPVMQQARRMPPAQAENPPAPQANEPQQGNQPPPNAPQAEPEQQPPQPGPNIPPPEGGQANGDGQRPISYTFTLKNLITKIVLLTILFNVAYSSIFGTERTTTSEVEKTLLNDTAYVRIVKGGHQRAIERFAQEAIKDLTSSRIYSWFYIPTALVQEAREQGADEIAFIAIAITTTFVVVFSFVILTWMQNIIKKMTDSRFATGVVPFVVLLTLTMCIDRFDMWKKHKLFSGLVTASLLIMCASLVNILRSLNLMKMDYLISTGIMTFAMPSITASIFQNGIIEVIKNSTKSPLYIVSIGWTIGANILEWKTTKHFSDYIAVVVSAKEITLSPGMLRNLNVIIRIVASCIRFLYISQEWNLNTVMQISILIGIAILYANMQGGVPMDVLEVTRQDKVAAPNPERVRNTYHMITKHLASCECVYGAIAAMISMCWAETHMEKVICALCATAGVLASQINNMNLSNYQTMSAMCTGSIELVLTQTLTGIVQEHNGAMPISLLSTSLKHKYDILNMKFRALATFHTDKWNAYRMSGVRELDFESKAKWPSRSILKWKQCLTQLEGRTNLKILEIGCGKGSWTKSIYMNKDIDFSKYVAYNLPMNLEEHSNLDDTLKMMVDSRFELRLRNVFDDIEILKKENYDVIISDAGSSGVTQIKRQKQCEEMHMLMNVLVRNNIDSMFFYKVLIPYISPDLRCNMYRSPASRNSSFELYCTNFSTPSQDTYTYANIGDFYRRLEGILNGQKMPTIQVHDVYEYKSPDASRNHKLEPVNHDFHLKDWAERNQTNLRLDHLQEDYRSVEEVAWSGKGNSDNSKDIYNRVLKRFINPISSVVPKLRSYHLTNVSAESGYAIFRKKVDTAPVEDHKHWKIIEENFSVMSGNIREKVDDAKLLPIEEAIFRLKQKAGRQLGENWQSNPFNQDQIEDIYNKLINDPSDVTHSVVETMPKREKKEMKESIVGSRQISYFPVQFRVVEQMILGDLLDKITHRDVVPECVGHVNPATYFHMFDCQVKKTPVYKKFIADDIAGWDTRISKRMLELECIFLQSLVEDTLHKHAIKQLYRMYSDHILAVRRVIDGKVTTRLLRQQKGRLSGTIITYTMNTLTNVALSRAHICDTLNISSQEVDSRIRNNDIVMMISGDDKVLGSDKETIEQLAQGIEFWSETGFYRKDTDGNEPSKVYEFEDIPFCSHTPVKIQVKGVDRYMPDRELGEIFGKAHLSIGAFADQSGAAEYAHALAIRNTLMQYVFRRDVRLLVKELSIALPCNIIPMSKADKPLCIAKPWIDEIDIVTALQKIFDNSDVKHVGEIGFVSQKYDIKHGSPLHYSSRSAWKQMMMKTREFKRNTCLEVIPNAMFRDYEDVFQDYETKNVSYFVPDIATMIVSKLKSLQIDKVYLTHSIREDAKERLEQDGIYSTSAEFAEVTVHMVGEIYSQSELGEIVSIAAKNNHIGVIYISPTSMGFAEIEGYDTEFMGRKIHAYMQDIQKEEHLRGYFPISWNNSQEVAKIISKDFNFDGPMTESFSGDARIAMCLEKEGISVEKRYDIYPLNETVKEGDCLRLQIDTPYCIANPPWDRRDNYQPVKDYIRRWHLSDKCHTMYLIGPTGSAFREAVRGVKGESVCESIGTIQHLTARYKITHNVPNMEMKLAVWKIRKDRRRTFRDSIHMYLERFKEDFSIRYI